MHTLDALATGTLVGIVLTIAVAIALKFFGPLNAATRALTWLVTLVTLPLIPILLIPGQAPQLRPQLAIPPSSASSAPLTAPAPPLPILSPRMPISRTSAHQPLAFTVPEHFSEAFLVFYIAVAVILLLRLCISYIRLRLLRRRTQPATPELAARLTLWLTRCPTVRNVELRLCNRSRSPLAIGFLRPIIVMPTALALELSQQEYDDLGVHELAHLRRYDDWTNLLQRVLQAILFFHPAAHYVGYKLKLEREFACDDWVVSAHESKSYASCLAKVVELRRYHRGPLVLSSGAFFGKRQIIKRVEALLDKTRNSATTISGLTVAVIAIALAVVATQIARLPDVIAFTQEARGSTSIRWSDEDHDLRVNLNGEVTFAPDDQSIAGLSPSGYITIDESKGWSNRRIEVRPGPTGAPEEKYFIDGREKPLDGVGRAWASSIYLLAIREIGIDAENRVTRILAQGGASAVLEEVTRIHSDQVKVKYLNLLLESATLTPSELQRVTDSAYKISSDNDKANFLVAHQRDLTTDQLRTSYFRAINSIHSDNDRRRVLIHLLEIDGNDPETARLTALSAKEMNSDNDKADVLLAIPSRASGNAGCAMLAAAKNIHSDNDKARVLHDTAFVDSPQCRDAYFAVADLIDSDSDRSRVLQSLLANPSLESDTYRDIANSAKGMHSDNDKANVLTIESTHYADSPFFEATDTIQSSSDRARVLKSVVMQTNANATLLEAINSAVAIPDGNDKSEILIAIAKKSNDADVRSALQKACEKISSDNDYRRVASAIFEHSETR